VEIYKTQFNNTMRFSGISSIGVLATCGSAASANDNLDTISIKQKQQQQQHRQAIFQTYFKEGGSRKSAINPTLRRQMLGTQPQLQYIDHANLLKNGKVPVACVPPPKASASFAVQEWLGVLSCGVGEYCVESKASHLGGFCQNLDHHHAIPTHSRRLQDCWDPASYCSGIAPYVEFCSDDDTVLPTCECGRFKAAKGAGVISCQAPNYCIELRPAAGFAPCDPTCYNAFSNSTFSDSFVSSITCMTFTEPYTQTFCQGYSQTFTNDGLVADTSCNISLNGVYCNACSVATFQGTPQENPFYFDSWNCTNLGLGASPKDGTFTSRFDVDAPLLTGDPDCSKKDPPRPVEKPIMSPSAAPQSGNLTPVSLPAFATSGPATSAAAMFTLSEWGTTVANVAAVTILGAILQIFAR
jgi:hypothetical protein